MDYKIGILSDVHARPEPVSQALAIFRQEAVNEIICAGDIAGYYDELEQTSKLLREAHCKTVVGNHDQVYLNAQRNGQLAATAWLLSLPRQLTLYSAGKSVFVVHAQPPDAVHGGIKLLDQQGHVMTKQKQQWEMSLEHFAYDILIVGHTHQVFAEQLGHVLVINPGSTAFNHSCMILDVPAMKVKTFALENQSIIRCWNFSKLYSSKQKYPTERN